MEKIIIKEGGSIKGLMFSEEFMVLVNQVMEFILMRALKDHSA